MPQEKKTKFCSNCGAEIDIKAKICPKCGVEQPIILEKVSNWWYLAAIFLGVVGGLVAWVVNRERNPKKALRFLIVGIAVPIIYIIVSFIASIVLISLGGARKRAKDARIMVDMSQIRTVAEMFYFEKESYSSINCTHPEIAHLCKDIKDQSGKEPTIYSSKESYCAFVKLLSGNYYCVDSKGTGRETSIYPGKIGYCNGITFVCP